MIIKSEMIQGKLYFLTDYGEIYCAEEKSYKEIQIQKLDNIDRNKIDMMMRPLFLQWRKEI